ncbi:hypothetical protein HAX54_003122 [Datura stramonium]|uniref:Uncharacterized protein n=1 Tax=Datura stramonium TaxID=4076 RepID=A0ABS8T5X9_DATST|nr:hypothetical protein [Datura stramonium]
MYDLWPRLGHAQLNQESRVEIELMEPQLGRRSGVFPNSCYKESHPLITIVERWSKDEEIEADLIEPMKEMEEDLEEDLEYDPAIYDPRDGGIEIPLVQPKEEEV